MHYVLLHIDLQLSLIHSTSQHLLRLCPVHERYYCQRSSFNKDGVSSVSQQSLHKALCHVWKVKKDRKT